MDILLDRGDLLVQYDDLQIEDVELIHFPSTLLNVTNVLRTNKIIFIDGDKCKYLKDKFGTNKDKIINKNIEI